MGGKDGSPGGGTFTPLRCVVAGVQVLGFLGSMVAAFAFADQRPWAFPIAIFVPFIVVAVLIIAGDSLIERHERRTKTGIYAP